jgi:aspartate/methionine/tyrosine aminotransferase
MSNFTRPGTSATHFPMRQHENEEVFDTSYRGSTKRGDRGPPMQLSQKVQNIPEALSIYINQLVYDQKRSGLNPIVLSFGEAFFDIPMFSFAELDFVKGYHYSESRGIPELREKIAEFYNHQYGVAIDYKSELLVTAGSKPAIYLAFQATLNSGDEVLIHEPGWLSYQEQARLAGAIPTFIPHCCPIQNFHNYFTGNTRILVINNPNNPSGRAYTLQELQSIYNQCRPRGIYVLVDEAYSDFVIDEDFHSMARIVPDKDGVIVVNSLSKNMGMSGWRVGYVIGVPELIDEILKVNQHVITCAPTILQYYMARYFDQVTSITLPQVRQIVAKRKRIANIIDDHGLARMPGGSTFYFLIDLGQFRGTSLEFALKLLFEHQISVVPGSAYGKSTERFVRIGIGTEPEERIIQALTVIKSVISTSQEATSCCTTL